MLHYRYKTRTRPNQAGLEWVLCGSANFALQGMDLKPKDLDITIEHKDLEKVKELFSKYDPSETRDLKNKEGQEFTFYVDGVEVQICGDYEHGTYYKAKQNKNNIKKYRLDGVEISLLKLEAELECYTQLGRTEKAKLIQEFLKQKE